MSLHEGTEVLDPLRLAVLTLPDKLPVVGLTSPVGYSPPVGEPAFHDTHPMRLTRQYRALMDDTWPRPCGHCGVAYDGRLRGVEGRFHMAVFRVDQADGRLDLVGHWREGVLPESGEFVMTHLGSGDLSFRATPLPPASGSAGERGQLVLRVVAAPDRLEQEAARSACVWGKA